jgi:phosphatidylserine decarboxylase
LQDLIDTNAIVYMLFTEMLVEVPTIPPYDQDPSKKPEIRDVSTLIQAINLQVQSPISYNDSPQIGTPLNAILCWPMATKAGFAAFLRDDVNQAFQKILQYWGTYLQSPASVSTIVTTNNEWLSTDAQNDPQSPGLKNFIDTYICDPNASNYGFTSWDNFFLRHYRDGLRPIASPNNDDVIVSAAEATPFAIQTNVQLYDTFWSKGQRYSLAHLLGDATVAKQFEGGTVYQAFLSADSYHNWHAPIAGSYVSPPKIIPGTYYSEPLLTGFDPDAGNPVNPDAGADADSQGYISEIAVRGVAIIKARNLSLGMVALVMIGMAEVSSVDFDDITDFEKGDPIGRFHFGGSTHCLIFGPNVDLNFAKAAIPTSNMDENQPPVKVCSKLAIVGDGS